MFSLKWLLHGLGAMTTQALVARVARLWKKRTVTITEEDPTFKTVYLGNTVTQWAKGESSILPDSVRVMG